MGLFGLTAAALSPTLSLFLADAVHAGSFLIGLFFTAYAAADIVAGLVTGWLSDRMRDRRVLIGLVSLIGAVCLLCLAFSAAGLIAGAVTGGTAALVGYGGVLWVCAALSAVGALGMLARLAFPQATLPAPASGG
ncbi:MAG: MFS transporter [Trebonia sp.]